MSDVWTRFDHRWLEYLRRVDAERDSRALRIDAGWDALRAKILKTEIQPQQSESKREQT